MRLHARWSWLVASLLPAVASAQTLPTASQVAAQIRVGWNVGNSMEVPGGETGWGNPVVSQTLINQVKAAGFNAVRIPCAWDSHANQSTNQIDAAWLARVKEVVDYVVSQDMYAILNIHWDGGWLEEHPLYSYQTAVNAKQRAYWTQIANHFRSYDEHLLFAGTNEVHADYNTPTAEHIAVQQSYNQTFVDAVRATGGNNATRPLVVQTYNTNMWHGLDSFTPPRDTATGRQIVEVHYYDPYDFTLNSSGSCLYWGAPYPTQSACTWAYESYVDDLFGRLRTKWVAAGVPVIIGEYGVATRPNLNLEARAYWMKYVNQAATRNGIKTFYWDNGVSPSQTNGFALFNRSTGAVIDRAALDAIMAGVGPTNDQTLTVTRTGTGTGLVTSSPAGITCGSTCSASYPSGTTVTLTAFAAEGSGSEFAGWSGACSGTAATCTVAMSAARAVTAAFDAPGARYPLTVTKAGNPGTVTSSPAGISCGSTCSATYASGTAVTLTAAAASGSTFAGWSGACVGTGSCVVTMTAARSVTATFASCCGTAVSLNAGGAASGSFSADSSYSGGNTYSVTRTIDTSLLTNAAIPPQAVLQSERYGEFTYTISGRTPGSTQSVTLYFAEVYWTAAGQRTFNVAINGTTVLSAFDIFAAAGGVNKAIARVFTTTANASGQVVIQFTRAGGPDNPKVCALTVAGGSDSTYALTVSKAGVGSGTVTSTPPGIDCGATCSATYTSGTTVNLTAAAASGSTFVGWSGACTGTGSCAVSMTAARTVTATFQATPDAYLLTVTKAGTGAGTVTGGSINCGATCSGSHASGTTVTLTAAAASGSTFAGWSGACTGTSATCAVAMTASRTVTATFNTVPTDTCRTPAGSGQSGNFNTTDAVCYTVNATIHGWGCSNADGRTVTVNGTAVTCGQTLPGSAPYTFRFTAGTYPWASFYWW